MRFYANSVSASAEGDYYQLWLDVTDSDVAETDSHESTGRLERLLRLLGKMVKYYFSLRNLNRDRLLFFFAISWTKKYACPFLAKHANSGELFI